MLNNKQNIYENIVSDVKRQIELGILTENERLPSCRELALTLGINPNTVQRAYTALEECGYIYTLPKKGVYVNATDKKQLKQQIAAQKIGELKQAGLSRAELEKILDEVYKND